MPIICAEYIFIKSIQDEGLITNNDDLYTCIQRKAFFNSSVLKLAKDNKNKYYENYCKLILDNEALNCVKDIENIDGVENKHFRFYFTHDCKCNNPLSDCHNKKLTDKAISFVSSYPCFPSGSKIYGTQSLSISDLWTIHRKLVDEFNMLNTELKNNEPDKSRVALYKTIKYIN